MMASLNQRGSLVLAAFFTRSSLSRGQRMQEAWVQLIAGAVVDEMRAGAAAFAGPGPRVVVQFDKRAFPRGLKPPSIHGAYRRGDPGLKSWATSRALSKQMQTAPQPRNPDWRLANDRSNRGGRDGPSRIY